MRMSLPSSYQRARCVSLMMISFLAIATIPPPRHRSKRRLKPEFGKIDAKQITSVSAHEPCECAGTLGGGSAADPIWRTDFQIGNLLTRPLRERNLCQAAPWTAGATASHSARKHPAVNDGLSGRVREGWRFVSLYGYYGKADEAWSGSWTAESGHSPSATRKNGGCSPSATNKNTGR